MIQFERIKELAKKRKMSLVEVNDKAGLGTRSIYHWKNAEPPSNKLKSVAKVLNTTTDYLNGLTDDPSPKSSEIKGKTTFEDLGLPYKGVIPDDVNDMYRAIAKTYAEKHNLPKRDA